MKKIIFLFLIFSAMLFAKWEVETGYTTDGSPLTSFKTYDTTTITNYLSETDTNLLSEINDLSESDKNLLKEGIKLFYPYIDIGVNVDYLGYSVVTIVHLGIKEGDSLVLIVTDNEGNDMRCKFHEDDIEDCQIRMTAGRSTVLTKMLYNGKSAKLMKNFKPIATFDLKGIKQVMQKHVGKSYWYKYKLND
ncbi:hypothetical protein [uncultured Brachyspira sp.]|uniref:hypothetical protein n=1 Tax=uncultured Brachyspira sp. TaxID=221953 RepID=UPI0025920B74|nr:hypothetical protein [uncultured Brachyspira sp.]